MDVEVGSYFCDGCGESTPQTLHLAYLHGDRYSGPCFLCKNCLFREVSAANVRLIDPRELAALKSEIERNTRPSGPEIYTDDDGTTVIDGTSIQWSET